MTESQREEIIEGMFPDWREHLNDGKVIDHILEGLSCREIVLNRCSRPGCYNVARRGLKRCTQCAAKAAQYMRKYERRKAKIATRLPQDTGLRSEGMRRHDSTPHDVRAEANDFPIPFGCRRRDSRASMFPEAAASST